MTDKPKYSAEDVLIEFVPKLKLSQKHYARLIAAMKSYANQEVNKACEKQRDLCAEKVTLYFTGSTMNKEMLQSKIRNAPSPQD